MALMGTVGALLQAKQCGYLNQIKPALDQLITHKIRILSTGTATIW